VVINRPIAEVFAYVTDLNTHTQWQAGIVEAAQTSKGPTGVGSTYRYVMQLAGQRLDTAGEVTEYEPNRKYSFKATSGPIPLQGGFTFEATAGGTQVRMSAEGEPGGFFKLATPLLNSMTRRQLETSLSNLKDILEARA
jgi:uncharacterized protein YndB with AHSA1/START domain